MEGISLEANPRAVGTHRAAARQVDTTVQEGVAQEDGLDQAGHQVITLTAQNPGFSAWNRR